jgi:NAD-dependent deacetylase
MSTQDVHQLSELIAGANRILLFTGAGISTGSGIPDFRGPNGIWKTRQPVYYQDFMTSHEARVEHWDYKLEGWAAFRDARPNATHEAVVRLEEADKLFICVTQNIDGLHGKAGLSPDKLVEIHGTNSLIECQTCGERTDPEAHFQSFKATGEPPVCGCGGWLKPATISFGQSLREDDLARAMGAAEQADLALALGSTLSVHPAASIPLAAARNGAPYVIINRGETDQDRSPGLTLRIEGDVSEVFPKAVGNAL